MEIVSSASDVETETYRGKENEGAYTDIVNAHGNTVARKIVMGKGEGGGGGAPSSYAYGSKRFPC